MTHRVVGQSGLSRCVRARIVMLNNDSSSGACLSNCSEDVRQTKCGVPFRIDRHTMFKWNSHHMTSFAEKTGHHLHQSDFSTNNFHWIWLGFKDQQGGLLLCFGLIRTDAWFVTFDDLMNGLLRHRHRIFSIFLYTNRHDLFFERLSKCVGSNENKSFLRVGVYAI